MAVYFFDSSALVKRYVTELGSNWIVQLTEPAAGNQNYVASITVVEVVSALTRQARAGNISAVDLTLALALSRADFANDYRIVELVPHVIARAMTTAETHVLRGYDAVQLAAALAVHQLRLARSQPLLTFISANTQLNAAAQTEGLRIDDPNAYP